MDVPNQPLNESENAVDGSEKKGQELIDTLAALTGLPEALATNELEQILEKAGHSPNSRTELTLDELRQALLAYLEEAFSPQNFEEQAEEELLDEATPVRLRSVDIQ